jgi:hypothetical protein
MHELPEPKFLEEDIKEAEKDKKQTSGSVAGNQMTRWHIRLSYLISLMSSSCRLRHGKGINRSN